MNFEPKEQNLPADLVPSAVGGQATDGAGIDDARASRAYPRGLVNTRSQEAAGLRIWPKPCDLLPTRCLALLRHQTC